MARKYLKNTLFYILASLPFHLFCQVEDPATGDLLEHFFRDTEQPDESDAQAFLENLEALRLRPLDLNTAAREDLAALRLLDEIQIEQFLAYRNRLGPFLNAYELQAVPGWELPDIRRLLPFVRVGSGLDARNKPLLNGFGDGENEILMRWGRYDPPNYSETAEGGPDAWALRYRHSFDNRMRYGFTLENDPGEALFHSSNPSGFDFYSGHFYLQNINKWLKTVAIGDFSARFGQGLLLQTGFSPGKSAETSSIARSGRKVGAYAAFGEAFFLRGAAGTFALGENWELTALCSARRRDANLLVQDTTDLEFADRLFTSLQTSGLHRTPAEVADEKAVWEWVGGFSATRYWKSGQIAFNGLYLEYGKPWRPSDAVYRRFAFSGKQLTAASLDYSWHKRNWYAFGELARSANGGLAGLNGILFAVDRRVTLSLLQRMYGRDYQSVYAAPFAEASGAANEQGLYLGADTRFGRKWQINAYADIWKHPWLRFGVGAPSSGSEYLCRIIWTPKRGVSIYALWQSEEKEKDSDAAGESHLVTHRRGRLRLHASYKVGPAVELRSRLEWTQYQIENIGNSHGFLAFQEAVVHPMGFPVSGAFRYAIFDTDDYETRVYAFENDLFSAISIPAFAGRGARYFLNLSWRINDWLRLESRVEQTALRRAVTGTGAAERETKWKVQVRMRL